VSGAPVSFQLCEDVQEIFWVRAGARKISEPVQLLSILNTFFEVTQTYFYFFIEHKRILGVGLHKQTDLVGLRTFA